MMLPTKILRLFICLCVLATTVQSLSAQDDATRKGYQHYVKKLFEIYDQDQSDSLDADELKQMRRKPDKRADANSDGEISIEELSNHYIKRAASQLKTGRRKDWNPKSSTEAKLRDKVKLIQSDDKMILVGGDRSDLTAVEALLAKFKEDEEGKRGERKVELSIWIVKSSESFDADKFKGKAKDFVASQLSGLAKESTVQVEEFHFDTVLERSFDLQRGGRVPVVEGVTVRGGQTTSSISNYEVGTSLSATTTRDGKNTMVDFKIEKSTVEDSDVALSKYDDEVIYAKTIEQFELEAEVECEPGKASVVQSKDGDRGWTLIFQVQ